MKKNVSKKNVLIVIIIFVVIVIGIISLLLIKNRDKSDEKKEVDVVETTTYYLGSTENSEQLEQSVITSFSDYQYEISVIGSKEKLKSEDLDGKKYIVLYIPVKKNTKISKINGYNIESGVNKQGLDTRILNVYYDLAEGCSKTNYKYQVYMLELPEKDANYFSEINYISNKVSNDNC